MTITSNRVETTVSDVFRASLAEESGEVFAVDFDEEATEALIGVVAALDDPPMVRLLARESVLKWLRGDFLTASAAAALIETDTLSLRTTDERFTNALLVTDESVVSIVSAGERVAGFVTDDAEFVASARERWDSTWDTAEEFSLRTPARSRVEDSLAAEFGPDVESDFRTMLDTLVTTRGNGDALNEVVVSLLVAAKHEIQFYDISKWGEDVGVASKATFSRTKTRLEERGLFNTEKVPIDVGRPRLRLLLGDERLREATADELAGVVQSILSTASA